MGTIIFDPVTLTFEFNPFFENFNLANNFWIVGARALIFHMSIPCDKTFQWVPLFLTLWPWPWSLTHFLKTLTLLITFKQWLLELWYFTRVFLVIRAFCGYNYVWPCDLDLGVWPIFKNFNLANNFWIVSARALIFHMSIPCDKTFPWVYHYFLSCDLTLTLEFDLLFKNFNLANNFWTVSARALIFHMSIPCYKTFPWVYHYFLPYDIDLRVWPIFWKLWPC